MSCVSGALRRSCHAFQGYSASDEQEQQGPGIRRKVDRQAANSSIEQTVRDVTLLSHHRSLIGELASHSTTIALLGHLVRRDNHNRDLNPNPHGSAVPFCQSRRMTYLHRPCKRMPQASRSSLYSASQPYAQAHGKACTKWPYTRL